MCILCCGALMVALSNSFCVVDIFIVCLRCAFYGVCVVSLYVLSWFGHCVVLFVYIVLCCVCHCLRCMTTRGVAYSLSCVQATTRYTTYKTQRIRVYVIKTRAHTAVQWWGHTHLHMYNYINIYKLYTQHSYNQRFDALNRTIDNNRKWKTTYVYCVTTVCYNNTRHTHTQLLTQLHKPYTCLTMFNTKCMNEYNWKHQAKP